MRQPERKLYTIPTGTKRRKSGFLFIPRCINGEYRWLENASWVQKYDMIGYYWDDINWE